MFVSAFTLSLRQLKDARTFRLLAAVAAISLQIVALIGFGLWVILDRWIVPRWFADAESYAALTALAVTVLIGWFLFRTIAMAVAGLFSDAIVESVEEDHYPAAAARAQPVSWAKGLRLGLGSARRAIGWNLLAAPFYLVLLVTGAGTVVLALLVNMLLLGRDLEDMVLARHPDLPPLTARDRNLLGLTAALLFILPVINLLAPIVGAAMAVHMVHLRSKLL